MNKKISFPLHALAATATREQALAVLDKAVDMPLTTNFPANGWHEEI